jgi:uncharacterized membrane protein
LVCAPGHYCIRSTPLVEAWPASRVDESVASQLLGAFVLGRQRSPIQDVAFAASQLTEVAVRALSPGINDPFTAIMCIDALASALRKMADRSLPSPYRFDGEERLRVIAHPIRFGTVLEASLTPIYEYGRHSTLVAQHVLKALESLASCARRAEDRDAIQRLAERIHAGSRDEQIDAVAQRALDANRDSLTAALEQSPLKADTPEDP